MDVVVGSSTLNAAYSVAATLAMIVLSLRRAYGSSSEVPKELPPGVRKWSLEFPKARIFPCRTTHARTFPKRHTFQYSYLQCGFPIVPDGTTPDRIDFGLGNDRKLGSWWLHIKADDYLERGNGALGFYGKLQSYLREQVCIIYTVIVEKAHCNRMSGTLTGHTAI